MPDQFEQLKQKYQPVLDKIQQEGGQLQNVNMDGNQLYVKATMVSEVSKDRVWNAIKGNGSSAFGFVTVRKRGAATMVRSIRQRWRTMRPSWRTGPARIHRS